MGVLLSRKSEARSIITGNSVSSSNSCLVMEVVMSVTMLAVCKKAVHLQAMAE